LWLVAPFDLTLSLGFLAASSHFECQLAVVSKLWLLVPSNLTLSLGFLAAASHFVRQLIPAAAAVGFRGVYHPNDTGGYDAALFI